MVAGGLRWLGRRRQCSDADTGADADRRCSSADPNNCVAADSSSHMMVDAAVNVAAADDITHKGRSSEVTAHCPEESPLHTHPRQLLAGRHGWVVSSSFTRPLVGHVGDQEITFGPLLGSGPCSRVYRGHWRQADIAVKVLPHDLPLPDSFQQHMQQLVQLQHPNVVTTHMAVTYTRAGASATAALGGRPAPLHDSAQQLLAMQQDVAAKAPRDCSSATRDQQQQQQVLLLSGTPPATPVHHVLPVSWGSTAAGDPRSSDSSTTGTLSPVTAAGLQQQQQQQQQALLRPRRTSASSLAAAECCGREAETWLVQEYCNLGNLSTMALEWQVSGEGDLQMFERLTLLVDAARGLKHLHTHDITHGDLNANNVLICRTSTNPIRMTAKVSDMGLPCAIKQHMSRDAPKTVRSMSHVAPERQRHGHIGPKADIYAFGIMMWEVYTGQQAYRKLLDVAQLYEAIVIQNLRPKIPPGMPLDYQLLMERCWASDPSDRPSVDKLIGCLSVMAAERHRRIDPHADLPPPATPAAAAAVAAAALTGDPWGVRPPPLAYSSSCDQATLQLLVQQHAASQQQQAVLRGPDRGQPAPLSAAGGLCMPRQVQQSRLPPVLPGGGLLHHKSCPATTFEALLKSGSLIARSSDSSAASDVERMDSADAVYAVLQEEEEMLQQLRASSQTRSGPGSVPVLHASQPVQRYPDGFQMGLLELDDTHTWHI